MENKITEQSLLLKWKGVSDDCWVQAPSLQDGLPGLCIDKVPEA